MQNSSGESEFPFVGDLITSTQSVPRTMMVQDAVEMFFKESQLDSMAVVEEKQPVGLLTRQKLLFKLFRRYGFELYGRKPVLSVADDSPLKAHREERLDAVLGKAMERDPEDIYDDIIVINDGGRYEGLLAVKQMVLQQSNSLANILVQKELAKA